MLLKNNERRTQEGIAMVTPRRSRFDPEYEEEENIYDNFDESDDEFSAAKPRRSRFEEDNEPLFRINKRRQTTLFDKKNGEAFGDFDEEEYDEEQRHKAPFLVRLFVWIMMLVLIGFAGYYAANYFIGYSETKSEVKVSDSGNSQDLALEDKKEAETAAPQKVENMATKTYKLYIPAGKDYAVRKVEITSGRVEQDMQKLLEMYFDSMREEGIISVEIKPDNIFKSGDLLYINTAGNLEKAIQSLDEAKASTLITGMLSTLWNNFSVRKVKFYINSKESEIRVPVDLSAQWGL